MLHSPGRTGASPPGEPKPFRGRSDVGAPQPILSGRARSAGRSAIGRRVVVNGPHSARHSPALLRGDNGRGERCRRSASDHRRRHQHGDAVCLVVVRPPCSREASAVKRIASRSRQGLLEGVATDVCPANAGGCVFRAPGHATCCGWAVASSASTFPDRVDSGGGLERQNHRPGDNVGRLSPTAGASCLICGQDRREQYSRRLRWQPVEKVARRGHWACNGCRFPRESRRRRAPTPQTRRFCTGCEGFGTGFSVLALSVLTQTDELVESGALAVVGNFGVEIGWWNDPRFPDSSGCVTVKTKNSCLSIRNEVCRSNS